MKKIESHIVISNLETRVRLSDFVPNIFYTISSKKGMKKAIDKGLVKVNGKRAYTGDYISGGETIELFRSDTSRSRPTIDLKLEVLFEDDFLAVVNKPAGIEVSGNKKWTLENALSGNLKISAQEDVLQTPEAIHRLDYPTSGALLIGKTIRTVKTLNKLFAERKVEKVYHAISIGKVKKRGAIETPIDEKPSKSIFEVLDSISSEKYGQFNLLKLIPHTGRRHQLRKHLSEIGHPILGDLQYGMEGLILKGKGLYLHASSLRFTHPETGDSVYVEIPLPKKFRKLFP